MLIINCSCMILFNSLKLLDKLSIKVITGFCNGKFFPCLGLELGVGVGMCGGHP